MRDRYARLADLAFGNRRVRIESVLSGKIEGDRKPALTVLQIFSEALISLPRVAESGVSADNPRLSTFFFRGIGSGRLFRLFRQGDGLRLKPNSV